MKKVLIRVIVAIIAASFIIAAGYGIFLLIEHNAIFHSNDDYSVSVVKSPYLLQSYYTQYEGMKMIGFEVYKEDQKIFRSEEAWRLWDFKSMDFDENFDIIVQTGDMGTEIYQFANDTWTLQK